MNKKGTTLMETIVAIFILTTATLIIISGSAAVIRIMSNANKIKNQSDTLLSFAETTDSKVSNVTSIPVTLSGKFSISSNSKMPHTIADIDINVNELNVNGTDSGKATLRMFVKEPISSVLNVYKNDKIDDYLEKLISYVATKTTDLEKESKNNYYNKIFENGFSYELKKFPSKLLPSKIEKVNYYIKVYYPWEYSKGENTTADHGGALIYLDKRSGWGLPNKDQTFALKIFYDTKTKSWYYNETNPTSPNVEYILNFDTENNFKKRLPAISFGLKKFNSYDEFIQHVKTAKNGWKRLNMYSVFDESNPDKSWESIVVAEP